MEPWPPATINGRTDMNSTARWVVGATVVAAGMIAGSAAPAGADGAVQVRGVQRPLAEFGTYSMEGSLVGTWSTTGLEWVGDTPSGVVRLAGTELFDGCYDAGGDGTCDAGDPAGTIEFSFTYSGRFDPATGTLRHGRCHHPVTGGSGEFEGVSGVLTFHDDPSGCSIYRGHLDW